MSGEIISIIILLFSMALFPILSQRTAYQGINDKYFKRIKLKKFGFLFKGIGWQSAVKHGVIIPMLAVQISGYILFLIATLFTVIVYVIGGNDCLRIIAIVDGVVLGIEAIVFIVIHIIISKISKNREESNFFKKNDLFLANTFYIGSSTVNTENRTYESTHNGKLLTIEQNNCYSENLSYDKLGRLAREDNRDFNKTFTFEYDTAGNILSRNEYAFTLEETLPITPVETISYAYDSTHKNRLISYNGETVGNYEIGNPWTYHGKSATWKNVHRLATFNGITYDYNYAGIRTSKTVNGVKTKFAIDGSNIMAQEKDDGTDTILFYYGLDGVTAFKYNDAVYYYQKNIFGDVIGIYTQTTTETTAEMQLLVKYVYDAWGNCKVLNPDGTENFNVAFIGNVNPFVTEVIISTLKQVSITCNHVTTTHKSADLLMPTTFRILDLKQLTA